MRYPNLSAQFRKIYKKWFDAGCDNTLGLKEVDRFLSKNPYYPEALIFKARLLIGEDNNKALRLLKAAKKIDDWRVDYAFDLAEVLHNGGKKKEALKELEFAVARLLRDARNGFENFLVCTGMDQDARRIFHKCLLKELSPYLHARKVKKRG